MRAPRRSALARNSPRRSTAPGRRRQSSSGTTTRCDAGAADRQVDARLAGVDVDGRDVARRGTSASVAQRRADRTSGPTAHVLRNASIQTRNAIDEYTAPSTAAAWPQTTAAATQPDDQRTTNSGGDDAVRQRPERSRLEPDGTAGVEAPTGR